MARTERNFRLRQDVFYKLWNAKADKYKTQKSLQDAAKLSKSPCEGYCLETEWTFIQLNP